MLQNNNSSNYEIDNYNQERMRDVNENGLDMEDMLDYIPMTKLQHDEIFDDFYPASFFTNNESNENEKEEERGKKDSIHDFGFVQNEVYSIESIKRMVNIRSNSRTATKDQAKRNSTINHTNNNQNNRRRRSSNSKNDFHLQLSFEILNFSFLIIY